MTSHINTVAAAGNKTVNVMRSTAKVRWGADLTCLDLLYKAISRSRIKFCFFV